MQLKINKDNSNRLGLSNLFGLGTLELSKLGSSFNLPTNFSFDSKNILSKGITGIKDINTPSSGLSKITDKLGEVAPGISGLATNIIGATNINDTSGLEESIDSFNKQNYEADNSEDLLNLYKSTNSLNKVNYDDIRGNSGGLSSILGGITSGASAGSSFGLLGAGIGAGVGMLGSLVGSLIGDSKAEEETNRINRLIDNANMTRTNNLQSLTDKVNNLNTRKLSSQLFALGGEVDNTNPFQEFNAGGLHEENPNQGIQIGIGENGLPNKVEEGETRYKDTIFTDRLSPTKEILEASGLNKKFANKSFADISKALLKESKERPNDPISQRGLDIEMNKLVQAQEYMKTLINPSNQFSQSNLFGYGGEEYKFKVPHFTDEKFIPQPYFNNVGLSPLKNYDWVNNSFSSAVPSMGIKQLFPNNTEIKEEANREEYESPIKPSKLSYLRYVPALGGAIGSLTDLLGLTNNPDYSRLEGLDSLMSYSPMKVESINRYMDYTPFDREYHANKLIAQSNSTNRSIENSSSGNSSSAIAGLLANGYNSNIGLGNLARQAEEYNMQNRMRALEFNRGTDLQNSQLSLQAQQYNNQLKQQRLQAELHKIAAMDAIDQRASAGRSANLTNLFNSLGDIGREEYMYNQINNNPALYYGINRLGETLYKKKKKEEKKSK